MFEAFGGIDNYLAGLNISTKLSSYGVKSNNFEKYAKDTIIKDDIKITPAEVTKEDIVEIYNSAY